jgi:hypothetical protein
LTDFARVLGEFGRDDVGESEAVDGGVRALGLRRPVVVVVSTDIHVVWEV